MFQGPLEVVSRIGDFLMLGEDPHFGESKVFGSHCRTYYQVGFITHEVQYSELPRKGISSPGHPHVPIDRG